MAKTKFKMMYSCGITAASDSGAIAIAPTETREIATIDLGEAATLNVDVSKSTVGDELIVKVSSDGTGRNLTFGTGITGPVLTGAANKTKVQAFVFDGEGFVASAAPVQID
jgi:hypothetical protein